MKKIFGIIVLLLSFLVFTKDAFAYSLDSVNPQSVGPGEVITITGSGFGNIQDSSYVCFGSSCAYGSSYTQSWSNNQIILTIPSYITSMGQIMVKVSNYNQRLFYSITGPVVYRNPSLTSISPSVVFPNQEIKLMCKSYDCFGDVRGSVLVGGQSASIKEWLAYSITAYVPNLSPGSYDIVVANPGGGQSSSQGVVVKSVPGISDIKPKLVVPGVTNMCIVGQNFGTSDQNWSGKNADSTLLIGGIEVTKASWEDSEICFDVPLSLKQDGVVSLKIKDYQVNSLQGLSYAIVNNENISSNNYGTSSSPNDTYFKKQYYLNQINILNTWKTKTTSENVTVAVIDDGIYINHPDLRDNIWINQKEKIGNLNDDDSNGYKDDIYGWDFISNGGEMTVRGSHGTHVAGIIGAVGNNSQGIAGITWRVKLMPLIACGRGSCPTSAVIKAIRYATDNGAQVINLSLGSTGTTGYSSDYNNAIQYAYSKGVVIVAASGNGDTEGGIGQDTNVIPQSPVCNDNNLNMVIGVGAVDDQGKMTRWSNYGSCVDVYAPGKGIYSTGVPDEDGAFYINKDGTSFSSPMVAGLAVLLKSQNPSMSNSEVIARIIKNSQNGVIDFDKTLKEPYNSPTIPISNPVVITNTISEKLTSSFGIGSTGQKVKILQKFLNSQGENISITGSFGPMTQKALKKFQIKYKISPTGFVGPVTLVLINSLIK